MNDGRARRRPGSLLAAIGCAGLIAACSGATASPASPGGTPGNQPSAAISDARVVRIVISDAGCPPQPATISAGPVTFQVTNEGADGVTEAEVLRGDKILGEKENITPGLAGSFSLELAAGDYDVYCANATTERSKLTVTAAGASASVAPDAALQAAVSGYAAYVRQQVTDLVAATRRFADAVKAGDVEGAKALYGPARVPYERIEPVAESFGDLDPAIDARIADVEDPATWSGFHKIEEALWVKGTTAGMGPVADKLVADIEKLQGLVDHESYQPAQLANGASELLSEVSRSKITGEEEAYSHLDLLDFAANVEGARMAFDLLQPALSQRDPALATTIEARFEAVEAALAMHTAGDGYQVYTDLSDAQVRALADAVEALAEPLSQVAAAVVGGA